ncbi:ATP-binding protein [Streptomyces sp. TS71-3]|uniref:ATP-binding protein n=1 Tax=Streptomyces sp. TS71-3 TaxID=2733862 RepID=UPI001B10951C|nr:ATP-binding protein [Streptomyces sp. TS71-3]GHJ37993.1 ATP-binding protein [Streptomyces sp. TS71-3]
MPPLTFPLCPQLLGGERTDQAHWLELPAVQAGVREARRAIADRLRAWRLPDSVLDDAILIVSELVTNAVCHTPSARILCCVGLTTDQLVHLEVHDHGSSPRSVLPCSPGFDEENGRGLMLVENIAKEWGVERSVFTRGNTVWAALASGMTHLGVEPPPY